MTLPIFDLTNQIVVVTGGNGQLGQAFCGAVRQAGGKVAILDQAASLPSSTTEEPNTLYLAADVTRKNDLVAALRTIEQHFGTPTGLVNCAALDSPPDASLDDNGPFEDFPESSWRRVMEVNTTGVFLCCQVFGGAMAREGRGSIVNIGSIYGRVSPDQKVYEYRRQRGENFFKPVAYSASKSTLYNLTRYLACYWAEKGVRTNILTFGGVQNNQDADFVRNYVAKIPMGRMARAEDYIGAVIFLLADASAYMTGSEITIDGGYTAL